MKWLRIVVCWWIIGGLSAAADEVPRTVLAITRFSPAVDADDVAPWCHALAMDLKERLAGVDGLTVRSEEFGLRSLGLAQAAEITAEQALEAGRLVEAGRILWGTLARDGKGWRAEARLLNAATGEGVAVTARSDDWWELRDELLRQSLTAMKLDADPQRTARVFLRWTRSVEAVGMAGRLRMMAETNAPMDEVLALAKETVAQDPESARLQTGLARIHLFRAEVDEALTVARRAVVLDPELEVAGVALVSSHGAAGDFAEAERASAELVERHPRSLDGLLMRGELLLRDPERLDEALALLRRAREVNPFAADVAALTASVHGMLGNREVALRTLKEAARLAEGLPVMDAEELQIAIVAMRLGDLRQAQISLRKCGTRGRERGVAPQWLAQIDERLEMVTARLTAVPVDAERPRRMTEEEVRAAVGDALSAVEFRRIRFPLGINQEMRDWVRELTAGIDGDEAKARHLFETLAGRQGGTLPKVNMTAEETFRQLDNSSRKFSCQESAKLYVVLAREIGLDAYLTVVERELGGDWCYHACAAVFLDGKCYLVDATFGLFGAAHRDFLLLDDLQAVALQLSQEDIEEYNLAAARAAVKLAPDWVYAKINLAQALISEGLHDEAAATLDEVERNHPERWDLTRLRAGLAHQRNDNDAARQLLIKAVEKHPEDAIAHAMLGHLLHARGDLPGARRHFRETQRRDAQVARKNDVPARLAAIQEQLGGTDDSDVVRAFELEQAGDFGGALDACRRALEQQPDSAILHRMLGNLLIALDRGSEAVAPLRRFLELSPDLSQDDWAEMIGKLQQHGGGDQVVEVLRRAVEEQPENPVIWQLLASNLFQVDAVDEALDAARTTVSLAPAVAELRVWRAMLLAFSGKWDEAENELAKVEDLTLSGTGTTRVRLILTLDQLGRFAEAKAALDAMESAPQDQPFDGEDSARTTTGRLVELEKQLLAQLEDDAEVKSLLGQISSIAVGSSVGDREANAYLKANPAAITRLLAECEVTTISVPADEAGTAIANGIRNRLAEGQSVEEATAETGELGASVGLRGWAAWGDLVEAVADAVFATEPGSLTPLIPLGERQVFTVVHDRREADAGNLEDPAVRKLVNAGVIRERRSAWERRYLNLLRGREAKNGD